MAPKSDPAVSSSSDECDLPLLFINYHDRKDKRSIGRHAQLASHRKRRAAKKIAAVSHLIHGPVATGSLAWRLKGDTPIASTVVAKNVKPNSPKTVLAASRKDPFSCYPIPSSPEIDALVDHLATTIGPQMCGYKPNPQFEFLRDRSLRLAMKDAAGFHICLSMAATHLDSMNGLKPGSRALWHRIESIRLVNRYLSDPILSTSDRVIFAVAMLMAQERIWSTEAVVEAIGKGLDGILQQRGGISTLKTSPTLEFALYTIVLSAPIMSPHGALAVYGMPDVRATRDEVSYALADEFIAFVENVRSLALRPRSSYESLPFAFRAGTSAHKLLVAPPSPRFGWTDSGKMQERARLATLLHVHFIVLEIGAFPERVSHYTRHFKSIQCCEDIWANSLEMLHHLVVKHETDVRLEDSDRSWKVLRIVNTALRLSRASYYTFRSFVFNCLSDDITTEEWHLSLHWDAERIREELMQEFSRSQI